MFFIYLSIIFEISINNNKKNSIDEKNNLKNSDKSATD